MIIKIPLELKPNYLRDPENFIRDIACISTQSTRPFFKLKSKVKELAEPAEPRINPFNDDTMLFDDDWKCRDGDIHNRYMHIDLGITKDAVGIAMCSAPYFVDREEIDMKSGSDNKLLKVRVPFIHFDFLGRIKGNKGDEILLSSIRQIINEISKRGFFLNLITYDGFQSVDSIQILKSQGYKVARLSIERTATKILLDKHVKDKSGFKRVSTEGQVLGPMQTLKDALYDNRLSIPFHPYWAIEAKGAEIDYKKQKVDHKPRGSIDLLQAMAGGAYNLTNNEFEFVEESEEEQEKRGDDFYREHSSGNDDYLYDNENKEEGQWEKVF